MNKQRSNKTQKQIIGGLGEDIACRFLEQKGFEIIERNYLKPYGEIDIVCIESKKLIFVEVKSVTRENLDNLSRVTNDYRPEDNLHEYKLKRLSKTIQIYLLEKGIKESYDGWRFDVITVYLDTVRKRAEVKHLKDIVL